MKEFFNMLYLPPTKVMLFGDACPAVTDPIAKASRFFNLIQLTYADTFTALTPNFFRIVPSEAAFNPARVAVLKNFNWTRVGTIYQNSPRYSLPHSKLLADLDRANIDIVASQSIADELKPEMYLHKFKASNPPFNLYANALQCINAYKEGLYGRRYQWNGMKEFFNMLYLPPTKVMLFGDACPAVTDPIAKASRFFNLIQ
ncbi:unnamed protein product, partial [Medioppia subpectinata]